MTPTEFQHRTGQPRTIDRRLRGFGWCLVFLLTVSIARAGQITATLDRPVIRVGESAKLSLNFEDCRPTEAPDIPNVPNLNFAYGGQSSSMRWVNGQQSATLTLFYFLTPSRPGEYTIPRIVAPIGGDRLGTEPVKLRVVKADEKLNESDAQGQLAFLKLITPKTNVYVGEVLPVEIQLYVVSGEGLQMQPLASEGFTFGKTQPLPQRQVQVGSLAYVMVAFKTTAVANRAGPLTLGPAECKLSLRIPVNRRRTGDPFDEFFNDPFGSRYELRPVRLTSDPIAVEASPLPEEGRPSDFAGAVGDFNLSATVGPTNVAVGDPVRLKVLVSGKGLLENVNLAPLALGPDFTTYPPTTQIDTTDPLGIEGTKTFQYDVVPQNTRITEIPAFAFSFFDPNRKAYRTLRQASTALIVRPAASTPALAGTPATANNASRSTPPAPDLAGAKQWLGPFTAIQPPLVAQPWFLWIQVVPLLLLGSAIGWRRWREHLALNPRAVRRRLVTRTVQQGLKELARLATQQDADAFFALTFRLLQEQLGERLDLPSASITEAVLDEQLAVQGVSPGLIDALHRLFHACNHQRYAPGASSQNLEATLVEVRIALQDLQRFKPSSPA